MGRYWSEYKLSALKGICSEDLTYNTGTRVNDTIIIVMANLKLAKRVDFKYSHHTQK